MAGFADSVQIFVDKAKGNANEVVKLTGFKILARLIQLSPVGNPELWKVNTDAVRQLNRASDISAALRAAGKRGRITLTGNRYSRKNTSKVGPIKPRLMKRGQGVLSVPKDYQGGRFRGNWQVSFGAPLEGETGRVDKDSNQTLNAGMAVLDQFNIEQDSVIYFVNNVPYAVPLEFGHSTQAPNGMVRITVQEFQKLFNESVAQVKK